jgi:hypothetical protein
VRRRTSNLLFSDLRQILSDSRSTRILNPHETKPSAVVLNPHETKPSAVVKNDVFFISLDKLPRF